MLLFNRRTLTLFAAATAVVTLPVACSAPGDLPPLRIEVVEPNAGYAIAMDISPDGRLFYIQAAGWGFVKSLQKDANGEYPPSEVLIRDMDVAEGPERGLLGLVLSPDFATTHHLFIYYTVPDENGDPAMGRIMRYTEADGELTEPTLIVDDLPAHAEQCCHFGGSLDFGPDGKLYLDFGDTNIPETAANPEMLEGSILRYNPDGSIPDDNPFPGSPVYAYGFRNGFGMAWHPDSGALYSSENGNACDDELNLIEPGADYGWGVHAYDTCPYPDDHATPPLLEWTPPIAPTGLTFYTGDVIPEFNRDLLLCSFLTGQLSQIKLSEDGRQVENVEIVEVEGMDDFCLMDVLVGPDGWLYTTTGPIIYRIGR